MSLHTLVAVIGSISASVEADGSFEFLGVTLGRYVVRVASKGAEQADPRARDHRPTQ